MKKHVNFKSLCRAALIVLCLMIVGVGQMWGNTTHPVYCAISSSSLGNGTLKLNVHKGTTSDGGQWYSVNMTKIATTISKAATGETKDLYYASIEYAEVGLQEMQFQIYDGDTYREKKTAFNNWSTASDTWTKPIFDYENGNFTTYPASLAQKTSYIYFNAADWTDDFIQLAVGHGLYQGYNQLSTRLDNTTIYYAKPSLNWGDAVVIGFLGHSAMFDTKENWLTTMPANGKHYTGYLHYQLSEDKYHYFARSAGDANGTAISFQYNDDAAALIAYLNKTQTVQARVSTDGSAYADAAFASWPGSVSVERTYMSAYNATTTPEAANIASATTEAIITSSITLTASGNDAYDFVGWGSSSSATPSGNNDTTYSVSAATTVYAFFRKKEYTVSYNGGTYATGGSHANDTKYHGTNVALPNTAVFTRDNYTQVGWTTTDGGAQTHALGANYTANSDQEFFPVWSEIAYTVETSVSGSGGTATSSVDDAKVVTASSNITATPTNVAWRFKNWDLDDANVSFADGYDANDAVIKVNATDNSSVTAHFQPRYGLHGSLTNDIAGGMPGWAGDGADFTVEGFNAVGEGDGKGVDLECARTLEPNKEYKFRIQDREAGGRWGYSSANHVLPAEGEGRNIKLSTYGDTDGKDVIFYTVGYGTYTFKITNMYDNNSGQYYPAVEIERQASSRLTLGVNEAAGGSVSARTNEGSGFDITNGQFFANGSTITFTATPATGCSLQGWYSDASCETPYNNEDENVSIDGNTLTLSSVSTNKTVYAKWGSTDFVIYRAGDKESDSRRLEDQVETFAGGSISKVIEYRMKVHTLDQWYSLCLPFSVDSVCVWDDEDGKYYKLVPYYRSDDVFYTGHYIIRTPESTSNFALANFGNWNDPDDEEDLPAMNTPYIIQWHDSYFLGKYISFFGAKNQTIPTTMTAGTDPVSENVVNVCVNDAMVSGSATGAYMLDGDYGDGAWLRLADASASRTIPPFECYLLASSGTRAKYRVMRRGMSLDVTPTGWDEVVASEKKSCVTVYSITGCLVAQFTDCSFNQVASLLNDERREGIYILRAENESVKLMLGGQ